MTLQCQYLCTESHAIIIQRESYNNVVPPPCQQQHLQQCTDHGIYGARTDNYVPVLELEGTEPSFSDRMPSHQSDKK